MGYGNGDGEGYYYGRVLLNGLLFSTVMNISIENYLGNVYFVFEWALGPFRRLFARQDRAVLSGPSRGGFKRHPTQRINDEIYLRVALR